MDVDDEAADCLTESLVVTWAPVTWMRISTVRFTGKELRAGIKARWTRAVWSASGVSTDSGTPKEVKIRTNIANGPDENDPLTHARLVLHVPGESDEHASHQAIRMRIDRIASRSSGSVYDIPEPP